MPDIFSTTHQMTVFFITDDSVTKKGFAANFTTGYHLGMPGEIHICTFLIKHLKRAHESVNKDLFLCNPMHVYLEVSFIGFNGAS